MSNNKIFISILFLAMLGQGCVSASKFDKLQRDCDQTSADFKTKLDECQKKVQDDEAKIHDLDVLTQDLQAKLGTTSSAKLKLEGNVTEMKTALEALTKQRADSEKRIQEFRDMVKRFKSLTETGQLTVKIIDGQMVVTLSSDVLFSSGSAHLSKAGVDSIKQVTGLLAQMTDRKFQVQGFTDNLPIKTAAFPSNWELASARALTVVKTMLESGMPAEQVSAASFGETHPIAANDNDTGRKTNRRIEIVIVPDLSTLPGYDQLQKMSN